jgi:hypothetical protein
MNFPGYGSHKYLYLGQEDLLDFHGSLAFDVLVLFRIKSAMFRFVNVLIQNNMVVVKYETEVLLRGKKRSRPVWFKNTTIEIPIIWKSGKPYIDESHIWFCYAELPRGYFDRYFRWIEPIPRQRFASVHQLPITKKLTLQIKIFKE